MPGDYLLKLSLKDGLEKDRENCTSCSGNMKKTTRSMSALNVANTIRAYLTLGVGECFRIGDEVIAKFADVAAVARSCRNFLNVWSTRASRRQMPLTPFPTAVNVRVHELAMMVYSHSE